jgi:hypothetical protein
MPWEQLREWRQYAEMEPFGAEREDLRMGMSTATLRNTLLAVNSGGKAVPRRMLSKPADFVLRFESATRPAPKGMNREEFRQAFDVFKEMVKATAGT